MLRFWKKRKKNTKLSVLLVTPFIEKTNGVGTVSQELVSSLRSVGLKVDVLQWLPGQNFPLFIGNNGDKISFSSLDKLLDWNKENYEIVHFQSIVYSDINNGGLSRIIHRFGAPSVYTAHTIALYHYEQIGSIPGEYCQFQEDLLRQTNVTIVFTPEMERMMRQYYGTIDPIITIIPNSVDFPIQVSKNYIRDIKRKYDVRDSDKILLYMGRLSVEKGVKTLAISFKQIKRQHPEVKLIIAGAGDAEMTTELHKILVDGGAREGREYNFTGWIEGEEREALFEVADLIILPSYYDHMPLVALEAMIRHIPLIMTDVETLHNTFGFDDETKLLVVPIETRKDHCSIAEAVTFALENPKIVSIVVERAYNEVRHKYFHGIVIDKVIELYNSLLH